MSVRFVCHLFVCYQYYLFTFLSVTPDIAEEAYFDLTSVNTPVHTATLARLLRDTNFDHTETEFLVDGFTNGFSLGYQGPQDRRDLSNNIPSQSETRLTCGTKS